MDRSCLATVACLLTLTAAYSGPAWAAEKKLKLEEVIEGHLQSIGGGTGEGRRTSVAIGDGRFQIVTGGRASLSGPAQLLSLASQMSFRVTFAVARYRGEHFWTDGEEANTAYMAPGSRSPLGDFLYVQREILKEGLLGGALSSAWPLLHLEQRQPRVKLEGLKKIDKVQLYQLDYRFRKGGGNLRIKLFFSPQDFSHVLTTYDLSRPAPIGATDIDSARQRPDRYRLEERFSDFTEVGGAKLPHTWVIQFSRDTRGQTIFWEWTINFNEIKLNVPIDPSQLVFQINQ